MSRVQAIAVGYAAAAAAAITVTSSTASAPLVTGLKVTPRPFYTSDRKMVVTFITRAKAPAAQRYYLDWTGLEPLDLAAANKCATDNAAARGWSGGKNIHIRAVLTPDPKEGNYFCPGDSTVIVYLQRIKGGNDSTYREVAVLAFRVFGR
jgi:hypothetical protein